LILEPIFRLGATLARKLGRVVREVDLDLVERASVDVRSSSFLGELSALAGQQPGVDELFDSPIAGRDRNLDRFAQ